jgi:hypothetical protein
MPALCSESAIKRNCRADQSSSRFFFTITRPAPITHRGLRCFPLLTYAPRSFRATRQFSRSNRSWARATDEWRGRGTDSWNIVTRAHFVTTGKGVARRVALRNYTRPFRFLASSRHPYVASLAYSYALRPAFSVPQHTRWSRDVESSTNSDGSRVYFFAHSSRGGRRTIGLRACGSRRRMPGSPGAAVQP